MIEATLLCHLSPTLFNKPTSQSGWFYKSSCLGAALGVTFVTTFIAAKYDTLCCPGPNVIKLFTSVIYKFT